MSEPEPEHGPEGPEPEPIPRLRPSSSSVLDSDDLLPVVLRRLPPRPSSLPRASLVCRRWRDLVTSRDFLRDFREFHRAPPVLGLFHNTYLGAPDRRFVAAVDPPDRVPDSLFRMPCGRDHRSWRFLDCRHGRALLLGPMGPRREVLVWDPMTGARPCPWMPGTSVTGRCSAPVATQFQVVLVWFELGLTYLRRAVAAVYSSESGAWSHIITVQAPFVSTASNASKPGTLAGNAVYWLIPGSRVLEFDAVTRNLAVISVPAYTAGSLYWQCQLMPTDAKELGLAMVTEISIKLWKRDSGNACGWSMYSAVQLEGCLPPRKWMQEQPSLLGYHEESNAIFVWIEAGVFMIQLESMQSRLMCQGASNFEIYPFAGFYNRGDATAGAQGDEDVDARWPTAIVDMWHYEDPQGDSHGPYSMVSLQRWSGNGFFAEDFRVWRTDETKEQAILLTDAMLSL
ncbi:hypothetical protein PAHAL_2G387700 [Panicum hallii]|uniref:GYF domain-containing protein n=1 Tax=Panicum hallii TaxID=206008 RepID=A0A2T8KRW0_9POAL|nr:hypothetical protein PAHAL_2G387700 [Panicum hallii]